jgi:hypothetical protein
MNPAAFQRKEKGNMKQASSLGPEKALVPSRKLSAGTSPSAVSAPSARNLSLPDRTTKAARLYVSPRSRPLNPFEMETRGLSYLLKDHDCPEQAVHVAAREMAALIWGPCNLIPVPGHTGDTSANLRLARAIAGYVTGGATVFDILGRRGPVDSACDRHKRGLPPLAAADHQIIRTSPRLIPCRPSYLVDNVTTSGTTLAACRAALGFGSGLVFADAFHAHH